jgi:N-acetylglucosaminyldiphosphoundecaprenol N-acetyl-beta-D-mannosaminyltransferase
VAEDVRTARPDILLVTMSSPRKEYWLSRCARTIDVSFVMGVGGAIARREPAPFQRVGLEWAYRLAQEPRRLWRRYAVTNVQFARLVAGAVLHQPRGRGKP